MRKKYYPLLFISRVSFVIPGKCFSRHERAAVYGTRISRDAPPTCYRCDAIADPIDCSVTMACNPGEQCFTDKIINSERHIRFNLGCKATRICDLIANIGRRELPEVLKSLDKRETIHLCTKCCKNGYCNNALCTTSTTPRPAPKCYNCADVEDPRACEHVVTCDPTEECFSDIWYNDRREQRHSLGCRSQGICTILANNGSSALHGRELSRREGTVQLCAGCCTGDFCNLAGCKNINDSFCDHKKMVK